MRVTRKLAIHHPGKPQDFSGAARTGPEVTDSGSTIFYYPSIGYPCCIRCSNAPPFGWMAARTAATRPQHGICKATLQGRIEVF